MKFFARLLGRGFRRLNDEGWSRGAKGNGIWLAAAVLIGGVRLMARIGGRKREVLFSQELLPGEALRVGHLLEDRLGRPAK